MKGKSNDRRIVIQRIVNYSLSYRCAGRARDERVGFGKAFARKDSPSEFALDLVPIREQGAARMKHHGSDPVAVRVEERPLLAAS
jgi:hypothetical protein